MSGSLLPLNTKLSTDAVWPSYYCDLSFQVIILNVAFTTLGFRVILVVFCRW